MKKNRKQISILLIFAMIFTTVFTSMSPEVCAEEVTGVTVTTQEQFMSALNQGQSTIIVDGVITIGKEADSSGKMQPVVIPAGTVIKGTSNGSLNSRGPIQLGGDNVCFQDIELTFSSSSALGSVPHREIFLAGYALTLDNVSTYLEGAGGNLGGLGGSESELLPTVYAGAFEGTAVLGDNASLIVQNANSDTQFQGIYMGHDAGTDNKIPYAGQATVQLDCPFVATEGIHTEENTSASITIVGDGTAIAPAFYGNDATTLTIDTCTTTQTEIDGVGTIVLDNGAWLQAKTTNLNHVTVKNGACLDFSELSDAISLKSFIGISASSATETKGILSLDTEGSLTITGDVEGIAIFQTGGPALPGTVYAEHPYIKTGQPEEDEINFVFPQKTIDNGFELQYSEGAWTAVSTYSGLEIGEIRIDEAPESVNVETIVRDGESDVPNESAYFRITWYDKNGGAYSNEDAEYNVLYQYDYVIAIKTEYWQSGDAEVAEKEDWGNPIYLMSKEDQSGKYYLYAEEGVKTGDYTFLFLSEYYDMYNLPVTVGDVKALQEKVLAQCRVLFYDSETGVPTPAPTATPVPPIEATMTPTAKPTVMPTAIPTVAPTAEPTPVPTEEPTMEPTIKPTIAPTLMPTAIPTVAPTAEPTPVPTVEPTATPVPPIEATMTPTAKPTVEPTATPVPTIEPTVEPTAKPTVEPTATPVPTIEPTVEPTATPVPTIEATMAPTAKPTVAPTLEPTVKPTATPMPTVAPVPTVNPTVTPSLEPTVAPTATPIPTVVPESQTTVTQPKATKITKLKTVKKGFKIKWKKHTNGITGYEIQYSTKKNFKGKTTKKKMVRNKNVLTVKVKKKTYYVRVRTYKRVKVNGKYVKQYSKWSKAKKIRVR